MIRFSMLRSDVKNLEEAFAAGYELDKRLSRSMDFIGFIHREASPKTKEEAYEFLQKTFFFLPYRLWIDGVEVK